MIPTPTYLVSISESEIQDLFRFGQPGPHPAAGVNGFLERNDLNRRRFQSPISTSRRSAEEMSPNGRAVKS